MNRVIKDYKSVNCEAEYLASIEGEDAEKLIGKTVARIEAREYHFSITFTDGSLVTVQGSTYFDGPLDVDYISSPEIKSGESK